MMINWIFLGLDLWYIFYFFIFWHFYRCKVNSSNHSALSCSPTSNHAVSTFSAQTNVFLIKHVVCIYHDKNINKQAPVLKGSHWDGSCNEQQILFSYRLVPPSTGNTASQILKSNSSSLSDACTVHLEKWNALIPHYINCLFILTAFNQEQSATATT